MSTRIEQYVIFGVKFGEEFTTDFWEKEFSDKETWRESKPKNEPFFITDGMSGNYTFFGFITQLSNGWDDSEEQEIDLSFTKEEVKTKFLKLYPELKINDEDIRMFYLPHWT